MLGAEEQKVVQAFSTVCSDEPLDEIASIRSSNSSFEDFHTLPLQNSVNAPVRAIAVPLNIANTQTCDRASSTLASACEVTQASSGEVSPERESLAAFHV